MSKSVIFMFPGQGSQYFNMGRELYLHHDRFKLWMDHCDEIVFDNAGYSMIETIFQPVGKVELFDRIRDTNPALMAIEYSIARVVMEMGIQPDALLGYSLGEFVSTVVSGCCSLEEGMKLVMDYADLIEQECPPGGMLAVIASESIVEENRDVFDGCWVAARNFELNFVVSGPSEKIETLHNKLTEQGVVCQRLPVNYPFHTALIESLQPQFEVLASNLQFSDYSIPMVSAMTGRYVDKVNARHLWDVCRNPVEFASTVRELDQSGECVFLDLGPSGSLSTAVKYLLPESRSTQLEFINQFGRDLDSVARFEESFWKQDAASVSGG